MSEARTSALLRAVRGIAAGGLFGLVAYASITFTKEVSLVALIWPANALLAWMLLKTSTRDWPILLLSALVGNFIADRSGGDPYAQALLFSVLNLGESVLVALGIARISSRPPKQILWLISQCLALALTVPLISALAAALWMAQTSGAQFADVFATWWSADALGLLIFFPALYVLSEEEIAKLVSPERRLAALTLVPLLVAANLLVFLQSDLQLLFLLPPVLALVAFYLGSGGAALGVLISAMIGIAASVAGLAPKIVLEADYSTALHQFQAYLAFNSFITLALAAIFVERERIQSRLAHALVEAEAATAAKADFLSNMSHELRTPLTSIIGFVGLLQKSEALPQREHDLAGRAATAGDRLLRLVNDVLDYSRIEAGGVLYEFESVPVSDLFDDCFDMMRGQAEAKGLALTARPPREPLAVRADAARLRQVMMNLLSNAIKFTASGSIILGARPDGDGAVRIEVSDTGTGINLKDPTKLFERFTQADTSTTRQYGGTGLGLAICKGLVEDMGGRIGVESHPGRGSTFWLSLPAASPDAGGR